MKKIYTLLVFIASIYSSHAQDCTPDASFNEIGVSPETFTQACLDENVSRELTLVAPTQLPYIAPEYGNIEVFAKATSVQVTDSKTVTPPGMEYKCPEANCNFNINPTNTTTKSCVSVYGKPTSTFDDQVKINVRITADIYDKTGTSLISSGYVIDTVFYIDFLVEDCGPINSINSFELEESGMIVSPNPINTNSQLNIHLNQSSSLNIEVFDILGKPMTQYNTSVLGKGYQKVEIGNLHSNLPGGVYILKVVVKNSNETILKKIYID